MSVGGDIGKSILEGVAGSNPLATGVSMATDALKKFTVSAIEATAKYEQFGATMTNMLRGNRVEADRLNESILAFAKKSPFNIEGAQEATKQLLAYGSQSLEVGKELQMLGEISAGIGAPIGEIAHLYGEAKKGGESFSSSISALSKQNIPIIEALAKKFGVTNDEVMKLVSTGKIGFPQVQAALQGMTQAGGVFYNSMTTQNASLGTQIENMGDAWDSFKIHLTESKSGFLKDVTQWATDFIETMDKALVLANRAGKSLKEAKDARDKQANLEGNTTSIEFRKQQEKQKELEEKQAKRFDYINIFREGSGQSDQLSYQEFLDNKTNLANRSDENVSGSLKFIDEEVRKLNTLVITNQNGVDLFGLSNENSYTVEYYRNLLDVAKGEQKELMAWVQENERQKKIGASGITNPLEDKGTPSPKNTPTNSGGATYHITVQGDIAPGMIIQSVDGSIPANDLKDKVGKAFLELINDVNVTTKV